MSNDIATLAALAHDLSDGTFNVGLTIDNLRTFDGVTQTVTIGLYTWEEGLEAIFFSTTSARCPEAYTTAELIQVLEQIRDCEFLVEMGEAA